MTWRHGYCRQFEWLYNVRTFSLVCNEHLWTFDSFWMRHLTLRWAVFLLMLKSEVMDGCWWGDRLRLLSEHPTSKILKEHFEYRGMLFKINWTFWTVVVNHILSGITFLIWWLNIRETWFWITVVLWSLRCA